MNILNTTGFSSLAVATLLWISPVFNNKDLFPESMICFRPKQVLDKDNRHLLKCDSNARVGIILSSVFFDLDKRDIEFSSKVATDSVTRHFDSNLEQSKYFQIAAIGLSLISLGCFSKSESSWKGNRNYAYHQRRKEYSENEFFADSYLNPKSPQEIAGQVARNNSITEKQHLLTLSELSKAASENELEVAKNLKEIKKLGSKKQVVSDSHSAGGEVEKQALIEALKGWEDGWLWSLIESVKPIFLIGDMGSAKTSMAVALGLIREVMGHRVAKVADRHLNGENNEKWALLKPELKYDSDSTILELLSETIEERVERIASKPEDYYQFILDEFTQLAQIEPKKISKEIIERFVTSTYSDTRKAKELFIGVTHSFTNASFGEGVYQLRQRGWLIEKFSVNGLTPIPRIVIKMGLKDGEGSNLIDVDKTLPDWFQPEVIYNHLNNGKRIEFE